MSQESDEMRDEYNIRGGVRGKYYDRYPRGVEVERIAELGREGGMILERATVTTELDAVLEEFARENPDLMEALETFGVATSEYERALRALAPSLIYTSSSTQPR